MGATVTSSDQRRLYLPASEIAACSGYVPTLDGLRAFSITVVLITHLISERLAPGGFGVEVFFVISGFIICRLMFGELKRDGHVSLLGFYGRRFTRLYPAMALYVALVVTSSLIFGVKFYSGEVRSVLLYYANYYYLWLSNTHPGTAILPFGIFWSLAIEEHFYLLFPVMFVLLKGRPDHLLVVLAVLVSGCLALRVFAAHVDPALIASGGLHARTEFRIDAIAWGVILAVACETPRGQRLILSAGSPVWLGLALLALLATFAVRDEVFRETWRYSIQGAALMLVLAALLFQERYAPLQSILNHPWAIWLGGVSYSLYVWHLCTPAIARWLIPHRTAFEQISIEFILSIIFATLSYYLLETPIRNWCRRNFRPRVSSPFLMSSGVVPIDGVG